eukprot:TRINITY_DN19977_c0_g1_i1.p1 TRINITY_DN19977_c0_g1~~TRINITY_DN19977_c0_g1_i1.p1  ORF type:complete len:523 (-),score=86.74 TRINITY_DN19977_c0_g1_i1:301-1869(-)
MAGSPQAVISAEGSRDKQSKGYMLWLLAFNAAIGGFLFGYDTGSASASLLEMKLPRELGGLAGHALSTGEQETVVAMVVFGAFFASAVAGRVSQYMGRRRALLLGSLFFVFGAVGMAAAGNFTFMLAARLVTGFGVGICSHSVPMYISECAPAAYRGSLCFLNDMCIVLGQVVAAAISSAFFYGEVWNCWRWILGLAAVPSTLMLVGFLLVPESPRWLVVKGRTDEAKEVLRMLRSGVSHQDVDQEFESICDDTVAQMKSHEPGLKKYIFDPSVRRPLLLGCSLQLVQQWVGINTIIYYGGTILQMSNSGHVQGEFEDPFSAENKHNVALTILINSAQLVGVLLSWFLVDRLGRKPLLLTSMMGLTVALAAMGGIYTLETTPKVAVVIVMMLYLAFFGLGMSPVPWTVNAEIHPTNCRSRSISFSTSVNWSMNWVVSQVFLNLATALSTNRESPSQHPNGVFWLFAFVGLIGMVGFAAKLPETKGKSLEEIAQLFSDSERQTKSTENAYSAEVDSEGTGTAA